MSQQSAPPEHAAEWQKHLAQCSRCMALKQRLELDGEHTVGAMATPSVQPPEGYAPDAPLLHGTSFGRYLVLEKLAEGGMGEVYAAFDPQLNRKVALKLLHSRKRSSSGTQGDGEVRLLREAQAMAQLSHPNVLPVFDAGVHKGTVFIAMELVEKGSTVRQWLQQAPRHWREVVRVHVEAGRGLAAAHRSAIVHRDLKPDNIMVAVGGRVYVMDFGLARSETESGRTLSPSLAPDADTELPAVPNSGGALLQSALTQAGAVMGTPGFMAPEQYNREPLDGRADQFALCASLYYCLYGQRAFPGKTTKELEKSTLAGELRPPPRGTRVPGWLHRVLVRGLARAPAARYPTMDALLDALLDDPRARHRRWAAVAGVLLTLGAGAAGYRHHSGRKEAACREEGQGYRKAWSEARQQEVSRALLATHKPYAKDAWRGVKEALDAYVSSLASMAEETCLAARIRGENSEKVYALRTSCLKQRHGELSALVQAFTSADGAGVERAADAARGLPALDPCADIDWLVRQVPTPTAPGAAERLQSLRETLAEARALHDVGRYQAAAAQAVLVVDGARALQYAPLEAEALLQLGASTKEFGKGEDAERHLVAAAEEGILAGQESVAASAASHLTESLMAVAGRGSEARLWYRLGKAYVARSPKGQERVLALLNHAMGAVLAYEGKYAEAEQVQREALRLALNAFGPDSAEVATITMKIGMALLWQQRYSEAAPYYERAVVIMERALGTQHPRLARLLSNLGTAYTLTGRLEEAVVPMRRALTLLEGSVDISHVQLGIVYNNLGNALLQLGQLEESARYLHLSLESKQKAVPVQAGSLSLGFSNLADLYTEMGRFEEARTYSRRAIEVGEPALPASNEFLLRAYLMEGTLDLLEGQPDRAVRHFERVLKHENTSQGDPNTTFAAARFRLAQARWTTQKNRKEAVELLTAVRSSLAAANERRYRGKLEAWVKEKRLTLPATGPVPAP